MAGRESIKKKLKSDLMSQLIWEKKKIEKGARKVNVPKGSEEGEEEETKRKQATCEIIVHITATLIRGSEEVGKVR